MSFELQFGLGGAPQSASLAPGARRAEDAALRSLCGTGPKSPFPSSDLAVLGLPEADGGLGALESVEAVSLGCPLHFLSRDA